MDDEINSDMTACTIIDSDEEYTGISLTDFPVEIFTKICSFLDLEFVSNTLSLVCQRFHDILTDETLWRSWLNRRVGGKKYPPLDIDYDCYDWEKACAYIDTFNRRWSDTSRKIRIVAKEAHSAVIDTLLLKNDGALAISGGRDRCLSLWDIKKSIQDPKIGESIENNVSEICIDNIKPLRRIDAHAGWIWDLATPSTNSNSILSSSWDYTVKIWDLQTLAETHSFKCTTTVLCVTCIDDNVSIAGLFSPNIVILDKRVSAEPVQICRIHKRSVLGTTVASPGSYTIYTTSEDRHVAAFDFRTGRIIKNSLLDSTDNSVYGIKIVANNDICPRAIFVGDPSGTLHMLDMSKFYARSKVKLWAPSNKKSKVTGLALEPGGLVACSSNGSIKMMNPSSPVNEVNDISTISKEYTALHFQNNVLVASDDAYFIHFWIPCTSHLIA